jgi:hypothetical protein
MKLRSDAIVVVFILVALWFMWFLSGGPTRTEANKGPFIKPLSPIDTGEIYGKIPTIDFGFKLGTKNFVSSPYRSSVKTSGSSLREISPSKEYLDITNKSDAILNITGWKVVNENGTAATIGRGVGLFVSGKAVELSNIVLRPGETAHVISGQSPIGVSFRKNICSGYLAQFQKFVPSLSNNCPQIITSENLSKYAPYPTCINYINGLPACTAITDQNQIPGGSGPSCASFVGERATYNGCVEDHSKDADFYEPSWMVYFGSGQELWKSGEVVRILDREGKTVSTLNQTFLNI